ncbi:MAG: homoserine dehydrogenase [Deferribacteraceae bacterium]|jgi:homoserine dehydrogenase|nr:homoserine dehydrogenase [Deferribacteraceae bacterium]
MAKQVNVGVIGCGIVGRGTIETLLKNKETILQKSGISVNLVGIADIRIDNNDELLNGVAIKTTDAMELINNPEIDIIVELIGGYTHAKTFILAAIEQGKHVVTANKALLATHGKEIFNKAIEKGVQVAFEASVGGGIPIIKVLKEDLAANNIEEIDGIINGTANYILTRMIQEGKDYKDVLADAQKLGYAEADPTFDVQGIDSAHKLTLLSSIAFGTWVEFDKVYTEGITNISTVDIDFAKELDCTIKLLAIAKKRNGSIEVRVHPTMIPNRFQLAAVNDVFNAVQVKGDVVGTTLHYGRGAGGTPTSSAVVADIVNIARDIVSGCKERVPALGFAQAIESHYPIVNIDDTVSSFYMRFNVEDNPGVLSTIAGIMSLNNVSISSAIQRGKEGQDGLPLVFLTHNATGKQIRNAVDEIDKLPFIKDKTVVIRVEGLR